MTRGDKRPRIRKAAQVYVKAYLEDLHPRFDAVILYERKDGSFLLEYDENVFDAAEV